MYKLKIIPLLIFLFSCKEEAVNKASTNNPNVPVELMFEHDGCKVYRFYDGRAVYFSDCRGIVETSHTEHSGKNHRTVYDETVNTGR